MQEIIRMKLSLTGLKGIRKVSRQSNQWTVPCEKESAKIISDLIQEKLYGIGVSFRHRGQYLFIIYSQDNK